MFLMLYIDHNLNHYTVKSFFLRVKTALHFATHFATCFANCKVRAINSNSDILHEPISKYFKAQFWYLKFNINQINRVQLHHEGPSSPSTILFLV